MSAHSKAHSFQTPKFKVRWISVLGLAPRVVCWMVVCVNWKQIMPSHRAHGMGSPRAEWKRVSSEYRGPPARGQALKHSTELRSALKFLTTPSCREDSVESTNVGELTLFMLPRSGQAAKHSTERRSALQLLATAHSYRERPLESALFSNIPLPSDVQSALDTRLWSGTEKFLLEFVKLWKESTSSHHPRCSL